MTLRLLATAAVVFLLSGVFVGGAQPVAVGLIPAPWDKLAHTALFAQITLALLLAGGARPVWTGGRALVALRCGRGLLWGAAALALAVGAGDEVHQASLPGRNAGWDDLVADALGILLVLGWALWAARHLPAATHTPMVALAADGAAHPSAVGHAPERTPMLKPVALPADDAPHATGMEWWLHNGQLCGASGEHGAFHAAVQGAWTSGATGVRHPAAWQVRLPEGVLNLAPLKLASEFDARNFTFNIYWEGAVRVSGARTGQGFVALRGDERVKTWWPAAAVRSGSPSR